MKVVKRYKVPFTRLLSTRGAMYNMINIITLLYVMYERC